MLNGKLKDIQTNSESNVEYSYRNWIQFYYFWNITLIDELRRPPIGIQVGYFKRPIMSGIQP